MGWMARVRSGAARNICGVLSVSEGELESLESNETSWLVNADVPEERELSQ